MPDVTYHDNFSDVVKHVSGLGNNKFYIGKAVIEGGRKYVVLSGPDASEESPEAQNINFLTMKDIKKLTIGAVTNFFDSDSTSPSAQHIYAFLNRMQGRIVQATPRLSWYNIISKKILKGFSEVITRLKNVITPAVELEKSVDSIKTIVKSDELLKWIRDNKEAVTLLPKNEQQDIKIVLSSKIVELLDRYENELEAPYCRKNYRDLCELLKDRKELSEFLAEKPFSLKERFNQCANKFVNFLKIHKEFTYTQLQDMGNLQEDENEFSNLLTTVGSFFEDLKEPKLNKLEKLLEEKKRIDKQETKSPISEHVQKDIDFRVARLRAESSDKNIPMLQKIDRISTCADLLQLIETFPETELAEQQQEEAKNKIKEKIRLFLNAYEGEIEYRVHSHFDDLTKLLSARDDLLKFFGNDALEGQFKECANKVVDHLIEQREFLRQTMKSPEEIGKLRKLINASISILIPNSSER